MLTNAESTRSTERRLKRALLAACAAGWLLMIAACETTEGAGRDIEKLGNNIENSAQKNK